MISLAMPTYNGEKYLREQLDSIYNQTMVPDEVIVVDDCSTDKTVEILTEYNVKYGLKYYVNKENLGYNKNFEKAITLCKGDYIALCDQDDIWLPTKIEKSFNKIKEYPTDEPALVSSFSSTNPSVLTKGVINKRRSGDWRMNFSRYSSQGCTLMFNRRLKEEILPLPSNVMYDGYIGFVASLIGNRYYIGEDLMYYRVHQRNAFVKEKQNSILKTINKNLHKYVPFWFLYERYISITEICRNIEGKIIPSRKSYVNKTISLYKTKKIKRIFILWTIKEIPLNIKISSSIFLLIKALFNIKDIY